MLQFSMLDHIMSLRAKQSAAIYFRVRPLIAKLICFQLWRNLAVIASGKYTHPRHIDTHSVALLSCSCVCAEVRTPFVLSSVWRTNERHSEPEACAHKHQPTHIHLQTCTPSMKSSKVSASADSR